MSVHAVEEVCATDLMALALELKSVFRYLAEFGDPGIGEKPGRTSKRAYGGFEGSRYLLSSSFGMGRRCLTILISSKPRLESFADFWWAGG